MPEESLTRRDAFTRTALAAGAMGLMTRAPQAATSAAADTPSGHFRHSVCRWCYGSIPFEAFIPQAKAAGAESIELLNPEEWRQVQAAGMSCAVANGPGPIHSGWNEPRNHEDLIAKSRTRLQECAEDGIPNMIVFSGNRRRASDEEGLRHCAEGLKEIMPMAESLGVTVIMELLNSKVDHRGYMCDRTPWGVKLADAVGSGRFKLLYDIYHMQIMEGDVIRTIRGYHEYIAHYHTGGVPGRNELDETQELYYPAICRAINETGYRGYVGQEFIPRGEDPIAALAHGIKTCTVA